MYIIDVQYSDSQDLKIIFHYSYYKTLDYILCVLQYIRPLPNLLEGSAQFPQIS